jgi:hypothetical protein
MGALHPAAWLAPSAVLALGPASLMPYSLLALPFVLMALLANTGTDPKQDRLLGTFAVPSTLLLVLALWLTSALGGSWLLNRQADERVETPSDQWPYAASGEVRLGTPTSKVNDGVPILENHGSILFILRQRYPSSPDGRAHRLKLRVYVLTDGTVDPQSTETTDATDRRLELLVRDVARQMVFIPLRGEDGSTQHGYVSMDVEYVPRAPVR